MEKDRKASLIVMFIGIVFILVVIFVISFFVKKKEYMKMIDNAFDLGENYVMKIYTGEKVTPDVKVKKMDSKFEYENTIDIEKEYIVGDSQKNECIFVYKEGKMLAPFDIQVATNLITSDFPEKMINDFTLIDVLKGNRIKKEKKGDKTLLHFISKDGLKEYVIDKETSKLEKYIERNSQKEVVIERTFEVEKNEVKDDDFTKINKNEYITKSFEEIVKIKKDKIKKEK